MTFLAIVAERMVVKDIVEYRRLPAGPGIGGEMSDIRPYGYEKSAQAWPQREYAPEEAYIGTPQERQVRRT
jgi:hypothetical protein